MQDQSIDKDLLQRFHQGTCTAAEREKILSWLECDNDETLTLPDAQMQVIEDRVWQSIDPKRIKTNRLWHITAWSGIAASILLVISFFVLQNAQKQAPAKTYAFGGSKTSSIELSGLKFRSVGNSNATLISNHKGNTGNLTFCGVIEISNDSNTDVHYTMNYGCQSTGQSPKRVTLKKGGSYVAMMDDDNPKELIVMRKEHLNEFPDALPSGFERI